MDIQEKKTSVKLIIVGVIGLALSYLFKSVKDDYLPDYYFYKQNNMDVGIKFFCINLFGLEIPLTLLVFVFFIILSSGIYWFITTKDVDINIKGTIDSLVKSVLSFFNQIIKKINFNISLKNAIADYLSIFNGGEDVEYNEQNLLLIKINKLKIFAFIFGVVVSIFYIVVMKHSFSYETLMPLMVTNILIRISSAFYCFYLSSYNIWYSWEWLLLGFLFPPVGLLLASVHFTVKKNYSLVNLTRKKNT